MHKTKYICGFHSFLWDLQKTCLLFGWDNLLIIVQK